MIESLTLYTAFMVLVFFALLQNGEKKKILKKFITIGRIKDEFYRLGSEICKVKERDELYEVMLETAIRLIKSADKGSILIVEEDKRFYFKAVKGFEEDLKNLSLKREEVFLEQYNGFKETAIVKNPVKFDEKYLKNNSKNEMDKVKALDIISTISAPIYIDGQLSGLINVDSSHEEKVFSKDDLELMNYIRNEMEIVLRNFIIQDELKYLVNHDELTGIYNRRIFKEIAMEELNRLKCEDNTLVFALIDIDKFKNINDTYGHMVGDSVLCTFANVLRDSLCENNIFARMSGDEFAIIFKNIPEIEIMRLLDDINKNFQHKASSDIEELKVNFSYGICKVSKKEMLSYDEIFSISDKNMYENKRGKTA